ncbi:MAG: hypothetical protein KAY32_09215 [Candidatus Eisenbacteria sp.]|nr:hypothetical protein [Candidatus Eisenbacteria bacterium]
MACKIRIPHSRPAFRGSRHWGRVLPALLIVVSAAVTPAAIAASAAAGASAVSRTEAVAIATAAVPGGSLEGVRLFIDPELLASRAPVADWKRTIFTAPAAGWFVFVDLLPGANWEHPCLYIFVSAETGERQVHEAMAPPARQPRLLEITAGHDNPSPEASAAAHAWLDQRLAVVPKPAPPTRGRAFAFIISGGANASNNHIRYWNDSAFIYKALVEYYGYADENIYVCIADGTDPAADRSDGTNSPPDLDGDGDDDIQYPATRTYIDMVFNELAAELTASDQLFLYTTDHGGRVSGWDCYLNLWNLEELQDDELAVYIDALPCETIVCTFEQCYSGGMIDDLAGDGRVIATAARYDEYSWAMGPDYIYDTFVYHWTCAVAWQDPDGNSVDADTNDDGIVSMEEAFIYAEANDFESETPQYSSTPADLGSVLNLHGNLEGVYLVLDELVIDDDDGGNSVGDGDGIIEFMETVELHVTLNNLGNEDALGVTATLETTSGYAALIDPVVSFGTIASGTSVPGSTPFVLRVAHNVPDGADLGLALTLSEDPGAAALDLQAHAPAYTAVIAEIDDGGDGIPDPGETLTLTFAIHNTGSCDSPDLTASVTSGDSYFTTDPTPAPLGVISVDGDAEVGGFSVTVDPLCPPVHVGGLHLHLAGADLYHHLVTLPLAVGRIFADDLESGDAQWTHAAGPGTWIDEWHLESYRNRTPGGSSSWKCGGAGAAEYAHQAYGLLQSVPFDLPAGARLSFWQWIDAETSSAYPEYCYDGGLLEISTDGGAIWTPLTPEGGHPYLIRDGSVLGPFPAGTPVWSGQQDWHEVTVDLSAYEGDVLLRWAFGGDGAVAAEGWYIDDVQVLLDAPSNIGPGDDGRELVLRPQLMPAAPNPVIFGGGGAAAGQVVRLRFALPHAGEVCLQLFDPGGRQIRSLGCGAYTAGTHEILWDGRDRGGRRVGSGSYYYRLSILGESLTRELVVVR